MAINIKTTPFLFSIGTEFSYLIDKRYYDNIHYVWCTTRFHDKSQPVTSNPQSIFSDEPTADPEHRHIPAS